MGRINNGDWANQHRKTQGQFLSKQDREVHLFSKKLNNGGKQQDETPLDLYNNILETGSILNGDTNPLKQEEGVRFIDGSKPHTPAAKALLLFASAFSMTHPKTTALPRNGESISTDNQNGLSSTVKNFTEMSKPPVFFDTISATTPTSQNHDKSKNPTKHSEIKLAKEQKVSDEHEQSQLNDDQSMVKRSAGTGYIVINNNELIFGHIPLNTKILKQKLKENSNITKLHLWNVWGVGSKAQEIGKNLKGTNVEELSLESNSITDEGAIDLIKSLKEGDTKVKVLNLAHNNISNKGAEDLIPELTDTQIIEVDLTGNKDIEPETLQKISKVLEHNRDEDTYSDEIDDQIEIIDIDSNTYTTEEEPATSKDISHTGKREKRDIHTTNEPTSSPTEDTVTEKDLTTSIPAGSSTSTVKYTTDSVTVGSTPQETTILKEEPTPTTMKSTVPTTDGSSTTMTESIAFSTEDSTTTKEIITSAIVKSTVPTTRESSTTTMRATTSSTEYPTTTEQEISSPITVKSTVPTTDGSSTTTTESIVFSTEDSTTTKEIIISTIVKSTVPTTDGSSTTTTESIAFSTEDSTTPEETIFKEEATTKESNPNDPASSTMSIAEISGLIVGGVAAIGVVGTAIGVARTVIKKFCSGVSHLGNEAFALVGVNLDSHLDNHEDTSLTGNVNNIDV
ncbi:hypothetical protein [Candidatus Tisiphia endosymbiont of Ditula angustiorana]|uniref:hypothetical protein n=1 Tax=Candidatus Tisiphia endosymbiont of Ditula angustiorana TaxID=3066272 RepID=UPI00312C8A1E